MGLMMGLRVGLRMGFDGVGLGLGGRDGDLIPL